MAYLLAVVKNHLSTVAVAVENSCSLPPACSTWGGSAAKRRALEIPTVELRGKKWKAGSGKQ